jgi:leucyl/phenylalanyl-tRNA--protein transferase
VPGRALIQNEFFPVSHLLTSRLWFPDPRTARKGGEFDGLVAIGGDLSVPRLLLAYRTGIFPWTDKPITWWSPDPRAILDPERFHVPRSLVPVLRKNTFQITLDRAFRQVVEGCAAPGPGRESTWISRNFIEAYVRLHQQGHAHSLECWRDGALAGGIYGLAIGGFFAGESMFHRADNASKAALYFLTRHLRDRGYVLFDIQSTTPVTQQLGASTLPRDEYLERLARAVSLDRSFRNLGDGIEALTRSPV